MGQQYTNALAHETSPYLLQHAHNPVDWRPWGPPAFDLARTAGKPIFLSVGYSTCYWCHVMERQCFENPRIAALMNEHFVCIKVDREERPDVDDLYMTAVQLMTGRGGWPMSLFLTPPGARGTDDRGLHPFFAGTYFPPEPGLGLPSFPQVLTGLTQAWKERRAEVLDQAQQIAAAIRQQITRTGDPDAPEPSDAPEPTEPTEPRDLLGTDLVEHAASQLLHTYDAEHGGFGSAPKFPQACNLLFLLKVYRNNPDPDLGQALAYTLERMARGGIYDQIGGGFHRYATDARWLVPHFEKMLYDQAQLVEVYLRARGAQADQPDATLHELIVRQTCDYVLREMTDPTGAFWSAQDAEVDSHEGGNYLWLPDQVATALGSDEAGLVPRALEMYGLDAGPNFRDPHDPQAAAANVLYLPRTMGEFARRHDMTLPQALAFKDAVDRRLLANRTLRPQPATDDKVLVSWNGMMIAALAQAGRELREPRYTRAAQAAARYIAGHMRREDGGLWRTMRRARIKVPAFLDDYAFLMHGLLKVHRDDPQGAWLGAAEELASVVERDFAVRDRQGHLSGGYYDASADQSDLFVRTRLVHDGAIPSGNSQMVHDLLDLFEVTGKRAYLDRALRDLDAAASVLRQYGAAVTHMQHALLRALGIAPREVRSHAGSRLQPISAAIEPAVIDLSSGRAQATVVVRVAEGYHINGPHSAADGLHPTSLELVGTPGIESLAQFPSPIRRKYPLADRDLDVYEGAVRIPVTFSRGVSKPVHPPAPGVVSAPRLVLKYQACTPTACLKPATLELPVTLNGVS